MKDETFSCPHHCQVCGEGWTHKARLIIENYLSCKLKRVATCHKCLKELSNGFSKFHIPPVKSLEEELYPQEAAEAGHSASLEKN